MKKIGSNGADDGLVAVNSPSVLNVSVGKSVRPDYHSVSASASPRGEVLPQAPSRAKRVDSQISKLCATRGRKAKMALALQVVSSHLRGVRDIRSAVSSEPALVDRMMPHAVGEADAVKRAHLPRLFLLDGCSLSVPLGMSELTAKFHVCNVLNKLGLERRRSLGETVGLEAV